MALVVDKTVKYLGVPDAENFTIQCSKPMSQLSVDDVKSADFWVGFTSFAHNQMCEGNIESGLPQNDPNHCWCWATSQDALYEGDWSTAHWSFPANYPTGIYMRNILVECALAHSQNTSLQNNASARIVMDIEAGEDTKIQNLFIEGSSYITCSYYEGQYTQNQVTDNRYIKPAVLMIVNDILYVWIQDFAPYMSGFFCDSTTSQGYRSSQSFDDYSRLSNHNLAMGWTRALETGDMYTDSGSTTSVNFNYTVPDVNFNGVTADLNVSLGSANYHKRASLSITDNENKEIEKYYKAFTGFRFKVDNVWYKPIVTGGIVTGYTDDMTVQSEWDEWDNVTGHNVPINPPSPSGGDDMDEMKLGATGSSGGFTNFYIMSPADLVTFLNDFYATADEGESLSNNIVCSYILGVPATEWTGRDSVELVPIVIHNSAQGTPFVSTDSYNHIVATNNDIPIGSYDVPRMTNTFYDFAPYSTYELFIPGCGWISLPDTVAGRTIYVYLEIDIATCGAKGIVKFDDGAVCAVCGGVLGSSIPLQIIESGLLRGANVQAGATALGGALMAGAGFGGENIGVGLSGISNVINGFLQSYVAGNTNFTNQKGASGDITQFAMGHKAYLKITYPPIDEVVNNPMFGHSVGYLCETVGKIKDFEGFTVCSNPHVTGFSCTSEEKAEIERLLSNGIIVHMHNE